MAGRLPYVLHKLNNHKFSVNNKMPDIDCFKLFGKRNLTVNGREALQWPFGRLTKLR